MKLDLDAIERNAKSAVLLGHRDCLATPEQVVALIARIRELEAFVRSVPSAALTTDKAFRDEFPELFTDEDGSALYMDEGKRRILDKGAVLP